MTLGPNVAGTWYPASGRDALVAQLDSLLERSGAGDRLQGSAVLSPVLAVIAPHAGYDYSGAVAASVFRRVGNALYDRVVLIGPSHYKGYRGAALPSAASYTTPLGEVPIESATIERLAIQPGMKVDDEPFLNEHSLEAEIPFLQRTLPPKWKLIPVLVGPASNGRSNQETADALKLLMDTGTLIVVSSDFTHYGPRFGYVPFDRDVPERLKSLDQGALDRILALDVEGFDDYTRKTGATICGRHAIDILLRMLPPGVRTKLESYDTSGRMTGDWGHCVSYAGLVFRVPD